MLRIMSDVKLYRYYLASTNARRFEWAECVLASTGFFGCVSDYGNYSFAWRGFGGGDFREFFAAIEPDYLEEDAVFIVGMRNAAPSLLAELRALRRIHQLERERLLACICHLRARL
jgi:hypothetical protein